MQASVRLVSDYVLLADALANDGVGANVARILTRESIDQMRRSRLDTPTKKHDYRKAMDYGYEYGLGVRTLVYEETSRSPLGEFGWDGYAGAFLLADVDNRLAMFFAMSVGNSGTKATIWINTAHAGYAAGYIINGSCRIPKPTARKWNWPGFVIITEWKTWANM